MNPELQSKLEQLVKDHPVLLFMKGTKEAPQCGFSSQVVQLLNHYEVEFKDVDVLADWDLREGVKEFSSWPTIPQLYVKGEFVGGCDIAMELHRNGKLGKILS